MSEKIQSLIDENKDDITGGLYLKLSNLCLELHKEEEKKREKEAKDEEEDMKYNEKIDDFYRTHFPNLHFTICLEINELDNILTTSNIASVFNEHRCMCCNPDDNTFQITQVYREGGIRQYDVLKAMNDAKFKSKCNHRFIEHLCEIQKNVFRVDCGS